MSPPGSGIEVEPGPASEPSPHPSDKVRLEQLVRAQAALRRVATLVANRVHPAEVYRAVAEELGHFLGVEATFVARVALSSGDRSASGHVSRDHAEVEGSLTVVGTYGPVQGEVPIGFRVRLQGGMVSTMALQTERPARINGELLANGPFKELFGNLGMRAAMATPIVIDGRYWGVTVAATSREDFPAETETRMAHFMELARLAIANANANQKLCELIDTQASLRRIAMLIARGAAPETVFATVTKEALRHFGNGTARMIRYEADGTATLLANEGTTGPHVRVGKRWEGYPPTGLTATVRRTGRAARVNDYHDIVGGEPYLREGLVSAVALPIHVHGLLWGMIAVGSGEGPLPPDSEQRMAEFTDLVATAVANAQSRAELISSRTRLVAASDEARRRIERNLHDGAQQRMVALALRLKLAADGASSHACKTSEVIADAAVELLEVIDELREISRGIHPALLSEAGLRPALRALGRRSAIPVEMDVRVAGRLPEPVEVGAYYVVCEALANAAKYAEASVVRVDVEVYAGTLRVVVRDDGIGGADLARGSGLVGLKDRIEALGGTFYVRSPQGYGTRVSCQLPVILDGGQPSAHRDT